MNRWVFRARRNEYRVVAAVTVDGRLFHALAAATRNMTSCDVSCASHDVTWRQLWRHVTSFSIGCHCCSYVIHYLWKHVNNTLLFIIAMSWYLFGCPAMLAAFNYKKLYFACVIIYIYIYIYIHRDPKKPAPLTLCRITLSFHNILSINFTKCLRKYRTVNSSQNHMRPTTTVYALYSVILTSYDVIVYVRNW